MTSVTYMVLWPVRVAHHWDYALLQVVLVLFCIILSSLLSTTSLETRDNVCVVVRLLSMVSDFKPNDYLVLWHIVRDLMCWHCCTATWCLSVPWCLLCCCFTNIGQQTDMNLLLLWWLPKLTGIQAAVFIVDWKPAVTNASVKTPPHATVLYCWNQTIGYVRSRIKVN